MAEKLYNFEHDGEMMDIEANTKQQAEVWADEWWKDRCQEEGLRNGDFRDSQGEIIKLVYDKNNEAIEKERTTHELLYVEYQGDFAEHNTLWGL